MATAMKPIAYYYDIQNCPFPPQKDPFDCIQLLRDTFGPNSSEKEFVVACDVTKEKKEIIKALEYMGLTIPHVSSERKESADMLLKSCMSNFAANNKDQPGTIVLIAGDDSYRSNISDLRYKNHFHVILLHGNNAKPEFLKFPSEHYNFYDLLDGLQDVESIKTRAKFVSVEAKLLPLPDGIVPQRLTKFACETRLQQIFRGRATTFNLETMSATLKFDNLVEAQKARQRVGPDCFGHPIQLTFPECKNWRETGGCVNGDNCQQFHFCETKGVDKPAPTEHRTSTSDETVEASPQHLPSLNSTKLANPRWKTEECKYYRGTGCDKDDDVCSYIHNPDNKGVDMKKLSCKFGSKCTKYLDGFQCPFKHVTEDAPPYAEDVLTTTVSQFSELKSQQSNCGDQASELGQSSKHTSSVPCPNGDTCEDWMEGKCPFAHVAKAAPVPAPRQNLGKIVSQLIKTVDGVQSYTPWTKQKPVKTVECRFYRFTGCGKSDADCTYLHVPENKGVDAKATPCRHGEKCRSFAQGKCVFLHGPAGETVTLAQQERSMHSSRESLVSEADSIPERSRPSKSLERRKSLRPRSRTPGCRVRFPDQNPMGPRSDSLGRLFTESDSAKSLQIRPLGANGNLQSLYEVGIRTLVGFVCADLGLLSFTSAEHTQTAKKELENIRQTLIKAGIFANITTVEDKSPNQRDIDTDMDNPDQSKVVYISCLVPSVTEPLLSRKAGLMRGFQNVKLRIDNLRYKKNFPFDWYFYYAFFTFDTWHDAIEGKKKFIQLYNLDMTREIPEMFTTGSKIHFQPPRKNVIVTTM